MNAAGAHRQLDDVQAAVIDALVGRDDGMTIFELRSHVDADIDELETALTDLKRDGLITADSSGDQTVITATEKATPDPEPDDSWFDRVIDRLPF